MGVITNHFDGQAPVLTEWAIPTQAGILANQAALRTAAGVAPASSHVLLKQFNIDETQVAAYLQADFFTQIGNSFIDGRFGLRWVDQDTDMYFPDPDTGGTATANNNNSTVLPSLMVR